MACYDEAINTVQDILDRNKPFLEMYHFAQIHEVLSRFSTFGESCYWYDLEYVVSEYEQTLQLTLHYAPIDQRHFELDNPPRPATRAVLSLGPGLRTFAWPSSHFGQDDGARLPVYFQSHAWRNVQTRRNVHGYDVHVLAGLMGSLENPNFVGPNKGRLVNGGCASPR